MSNFGALLAPRRPPAAAPRALPDGRGREHPRRRGRRRRLGRRGEAAEWSPLPGGQRRRAAAPLVRSRSSAPSRSPATPRRDRSGACSCGRSRARRRPSRARSCSRSGSPPSTSRASLVALLVAVALDRFGTITLGAGGELRRHHSARRISSASRRVARRAGASRARLRGARRPHGQLVVERPVLVGDLRPAPGPPPYLVEIALGGVEPVAVHARRGVRRLGPLRARRAASRRGSRSPQAGATCGSRSRCRSWRPPRPSRAVASCSPSATSRVAPGKRVQRRSNRTRRAPAASRSDPETASPARGGPERIGPLARRARGRARTPCPYEIEHARALARSRDQHLAAHEGDQVLEARAPNLVAAPRPSRRSGRRARSSARGGRARAVERVDEEGRRHARLDEDRELLERRRAPAGGRR